MNLILKKIILATVFLLPFMIFTRGFYGSVFAKSVFIEGVTLILISLYLIGKLYKKDVGFIQKNIILGSFGLYVIILIISGLQGVLPSLSFWSSFDQGTGVIFMICLFVFSLITSSVFKNLDDWYKLFTVFSVSGIIFTLASLLTNIGVKYSKFLDLNTLSGFSIGNSSWTGIYLSFVFFISLGLAFAGNTKFQRIIGIIAIITAYFDPTLSGFIIQAPGAVFGPIGLAQTGSYSLFVGIGLFVLYLIFRKIKSIKWRKVFIISGISIFIVSLIVFIFVGIKPFRNLVAEKAGPNRLVYWDIAVEGFKDRPVLGWGGDTYQYVYGKYFNPIILTPGYAREYWVDKSHNIFFDELVTGGLLGLVSLVFLYIVLLFFLIKKAILNLDKEGIFLMALFAGLTSFIIQGLMLFQTIIGWFVVALIIAFVSNICIKDIPKKENEINKNNKKDDSSFNFLFLIIIFIIFCIVFNYVVIKPNKINKGLAQFPEMSYVKRLEFFRELNNTYIGNNVDLGNAFSPYHIKLRRIVKNGIKDNEKSLMAEEIKSINNLIDNSLVRQNYMDVKLLTSNVGLYSVLIGISPEQDKKVLYDKGMFYVNKITEISNKNPITKFAPSLLNVSFKYGEEGINALDTEKAR